MTTCTLGTKIKQERERLGLSQTALADLIGSTKQSVFSWESDKTIPNANVLIQLHKAGVDVHYLITGERYQYFFNAAESLVLRMFRESSEDVRNMIFAMAKDFLVRKLAREKCDEENSVAK